MARSEAAKEKDEASKGVRPRKHGSNRDMPDSRHGGDYTQRNRKEKPEFTAAFPPDDEDLLRGRTAAPARRISTGTGSPRVVRRGRFRNSAGIGFDQAR